MDEGRQVEKRRSVERELIVNDLVRAVRTCSLEERSIPSACRGSEVDHLRRDLILGDGVSAVARAVGMRSRRLVVSRQMVRVRLMVLEADE